MRAFIILCFFIVVRADTTVQSVSSTTTSRVANKTSTQQNYSEIDNITSGNITTNGSTTTKANEHGEKGSVDVVFCILVVFAIVFGIIGFMSYVIKRS